MQTDFILAYNTSTGILTHFGDQIKEFSHRTCSGENLKFRVTPNGLVWQVPFFLLDNIFYLQISENIYFTRHIDVFRKLAEADIDANILLKENGFLPHARTQLKDVGIICSYLTYTVGSTGIDINHCFPHDAITERFTIDDLMDSFRAAFKKQVERVNRDTWVLPLSGGMDSRLLLSLALEYKDVDLHLYTVGTKRSGDIRVAKAIAKSLGLEKQHKVQYLEEMNKFDLLRNYRACDYLLPLDRVLTRPLGELFKPAAVISGLYGDVIFADNNQIEVDYATYYRNEGFKTYNTQDMQIVQSYDCLPRLHKLQRLALRCQKLTRQSFPISPGFDFVTPFVDPKVLMVASLLQSTRIYPELVARHMRTDLRQFIHQSTVSYFTHPDWLRIAERKVFKLLRHPVRTPYFDSAYLQSIGVSTNEVPFLE